MTHLLLIIIYLSFISLGLPDALLGAAWPVMHTELGVPLSHAGILSMIIFSCTVISSLASAHVIRILGTPRVTALSVAMTAAALFGFSMSGSFGPLCFWAVPYGLGAGSIDAALNNYVALHYASRHMSWLHCMWGVGAAGGPCIMGWALAAEGWPLGYGVIGCMQLVLAVVIACSLPLWRRSAAPAPAADEKKGSIFGALRLPGAPWALGSFFFYCSLETSTGLWASSYFVLIHGIEATTAAWYASLFFFGITLGRGASGFLTLRYTDPQMMHIGQTGILVGVLLLFAPWSITAVAGFVLIGLGCAPIFPSMVHATPELFGPSDSQALIGMQIAAANFANCFVPSLFGVLAQWVGIGTLPMFLCALLLLQTAAAELTRRRAAVCI